MQNRIRFLERYSMIFTANSKMAFCVLLINEEQELCCKIVILRRKS